MRMRSLLAAFAVLVLVTPAGAVPGDQATFNQGVAAYDAGNFEEAYKIFHDLAENDDLAAMRNVALMLRNGKGVEKDPDKALDWYERAAEAGLVTAQSDLGVMLLDGEAGDPDPKAALPWLMLAAAAGHPTAQFRLGEMYEKGTDFMSPDVEGAKLLYGAAAAHRQRGAAARLAALLGLNELPPAATTAPPFTDRVEVTSVKSAKQSHKLPPPKLRATTLPAPEPAPAATAPEAAPAAPSPSPAANESTIHKTFPGPQLKPSP